VLSGVLVGADMFVMVANRDGRGVKNGRK